MQKVLIALLQIGTDPTDDEDLRLRKLLLLTAALLILPAAVAWGAIYWLFGEWSAALVPWAYALLSLVSVVLLALTRRYVPFAAMQLLCFVLLPFVLMWILGGFVAGSAVGVWAWLAPVGARLLGHRRATAALYLLFAVGFALTAFAQTPPSGTTLPEPVIAGFFVANIVVASGIALVLLDSSAGGREGTLVTMRTLVRRYFSPAVVDAITADPRRLELGGEVAEVTILFADLGGYTTYAGSRPPAEVVVLLNTLFAAALPAVVAHGGTPVALPGDALMAVFGAPQVQPDHARRAARAALGIQRAGRELADSHPDWPTFRIGVNSGDALVGNIGSDEYRAFTAIGDTTNMAQRFQTLAEPGQIVLGPRTTELLGGAAEILPLGEVVVKGKSEPVTPAALLALQEPAQVR
jgi:class 3 adenylate cyclase